VNRGRDKEYRIQARLSGNSAKTAAFGEDCCIRRAVEHPGQRVQQRGGAPPPP
jgi:hypothetical protein